MRQSFAQITSIVSQYQHYWRQDPFHQVVSQQIQWRQENPALYQWLQTLTVSDITFFKENLTECVTQLEPFLPGIFALHQSIQLATVEQTDVTALPRGLDSGIPGRKLEQIKQMSNACLHHHHGNEWLEWCSGKGFLGRLLAAQSGQKVTSFEYQQALCEAGQIEADKRALPMTFVQGDAFSDEANHVFNGRQHAVALHACGDLHIELIQYSVKHQLPALTLSPCCYHLIRGNEYQPLSKAARATHFSLSKQELRIPLQETVTGGERVRRHREQEMVFRLGFDALCRENHLCEGYMPVPSLKKSQLSGGFRALCEWAAAKKSLSLPDVNFDYYERLGYERYWQMEALSLVQGVFRRPLEVWLAMDKVLYLEEQGYQVRLTTFCDSQTTPRNLLIHASYQQ